MASLYILQSEKTGQYYVGSTTDLDRRLSEQQRGHTPSTRKRGPWKLIHREDFATLLEARQRETEIKRWKSARLIKKLVPARQSVRAGRLGRPALRFESAWAYHLIAMDLGALLPPCSWEFPTDLLTVESFDLIVGFPTIGLSTDSGAAIRYVVQSRAGLRS